MNRSNFLYLLIGALVVAVGVLGYLSYSHQESQKADGLEITIGSGGVTVKEN
jgi:hypothetical protein